MAIRADRVGVRQDQVDVHGRVTSPSFLNELLENLPEWTDMPVWVNGTEEVLPSNTSVPVTSPILADIAYPDIRRDNQYFTYRESPTPVDGLAKIKSIKGNTLVWNQLVQNGNFADSSNWVAEGSATINSITNNTINVTTASASNSGIAQISFPMTNRHKYLLVATIKTTGQTNISVSGLGSILFNTNSFVTKGSVFTWTAGTGSQWSVRIRNFDANSATFEARNVMLFDLTQMDLDISADEFVSLFNLPYYDYNAGTLLSFNGTGIKTTGANLLDKTKSETGGIDANGNYVEGINLWRTTDFIPVEEGQTYSFSSFGNFDFLRIYYYDIGFNFISPRIESSFKSSLTVTIPSGIKYIKWTLYNVTVAITQEIVSNSRLQISKGQPIVQYEPYTTQTTSLPISTYFPTGMKSAGIVYDELTPRKAITRIGAVDMGTLTWIYNSTYEFFYADLVNASPFTEALQKTLVCPIYETGTTVNSASQMANIDNKTIRGRRGVATTQIYVKDTSYSSATDLVNALSGVYLYYELATPVELPTMSFE